MTVSRLDCLLPASIHCRLCGRPALGATVTAHYGVEVLKVYEA